MVLGSGGLLLQECGGSSENGEIVEKEGIGRGEL